MGKGLIKLLREIIDELLDIIYPPKNKCITCDNEVIGVCPICKSKIMRVKEESKILSYGYYSGVMKKLILEFKYNKNFLAGNILADYLCELINENNIDVDAILFIPSSKKALKDRGFNNNLYSFAHSMGGAIGTIFLENNHGYFKKVILNSPMFRINTREYSHIKCKLIAKFLILMGKGENFIFGQEPFEEEENLEASGTSDKLRHGLYHKFLLDNPILRRGGGSIHWYKEAAKATDYLMKKRNIERIDTPILLFKSEFDSYVDTKFHDEFKKLAKDCELIEVKGSKHEGFFEKDEILYDYLDKIFKFLEENN